MPWIKYRSFEEAEAALHVIGSPQDRWKRIAALWRTASRIGRRRFPPGVYKYRSIEDAAAERERWSQPAVIAKRAERTTRRH